MNALKIFAQMILICLLLSLPSIACAYEYKNNIWYEDGESFNIAHLNKALDENKIDEVEKIYNEWVERRQKMLANGNKLGKWDMYLKYIHATILFHKKDYEKCIANADEVFDYLKATTAYELDEDDLLWTHVTAGCLGLKQWSYYELGDQENALMAREERVKFYEEVLQSNIKFHGETSKRVLVIGADLIEVYESFGERERRGFLLDYLLPIAEKTLKDDSLLKQGLLYNKALHYSNEGNVAKTKEILERLLTMPTTAKNQVLYRLFMSQVYSFSNDYSNAINCVMQAYDIYEKNFPEDKKTRVNILNFMSNLYLELGRYDDALKFAQEASALSAEFFAYDTGFIISAKEKLALCYYMTKRYYDAFNLCKECYELCIKLYGNDSPKKFPIIRHLIAIHRELEEYESGIYLTKEMLKESIMICGEKNINTLMGWIILANFYMLNGEDIDEAIKIYEMVLKTSSEILPEQNQLVITALASLVEAYEKNSRLKEAITSSEILIEKLENLLSGYGSLNDTEKRILFADESIAYVDTAALYYRDNNFNDAFRILERGRSRLLIDSYAEQIVKSGGILDEKEVAKLNGYKAGLANYSRLIDEAFNSGDEQARFNLETEQRNLSAEYVQYKESLKNKYPKYKNVSQANKLNFERDKKILPSDTGFVEFMFWDKKIIAFTFDKDSEINAMRIDTPENFFAKCNLYRELLAYTDLQSMQEKNKFLVKLPDGSYKINVGKTGKKGSGEKYISDEEIFNELKRNLSKEIGEVLLTPLKDKISDYSNLIISPDGDLNNIPFETLEFNDKLAIESFNISYVPSFAVFKLMHEAGEKNSKLTNRREFFAMGNAFYGNNDEATSRGSKEDFFRGHRGKYDVTELQKIQWHNLPGTEKEIKTVSKLFSTKKIFSKKSAAESNLKSLSRSDELSKYKYFLFATHGIFVPYAPEYSSIVLSQGVDKNEDGYVTIGEWMGLDLNSDLVFLSACESGLGEFQAGEGIVGIPYALTIAGNKNTVMSLWEVQDEPTADFVSTFFKKLRDGKPSFVALNETKREFLRSSNSVYQNPAIWAAFLLYGF